MAIIRTTALALAIGMAGLAPAAAQTADATEGSGTAAPLSPDKVVATVGGRAITEGDLALAMQQPGEPQGTAEQRRASALSALIDLRAVAARGEAAGLADEDLERRVKFLRDRELHNAYLSQTIEPAITEALLRERYDQEVAGIEPTEEVRASHILLETEEDAREVITALDGGADFAELARSRSTGPTAARGGDLGYFGPGRMVPAFDEAARALPVGEYTREPVQTQFGFHVIQVNDKREVGPPPFDQVRPQIREIVSRELYVETLRKARNEANVSIEDPALARLLAASVPGAGASGDAAEPEEPANDNAAGEGATDGDGAETEAQ